MPNLSSRPTQIIIGIALIIALSACQPNVATIEPTMANTPTVQPSNTPIPTATPTSTTTPEASVLAKPEVLGVVSRDKYIFTIPIEKIKVEFDTSGSLGTLMEIKDINGNPILIAGDGTNGFLEINGKIPTDSTRNALKSGDKLTVYIDRNGKQILYQVDDKYVASGNYSGDNVKSIQIVRGAGEASITNITTVGFPNIGTTKLIDVSAVGATPTKPPVAVATAQGQGNVEAVKPTPVIEQKLDISKFSPDQQNIIKSRFPADLLKGGEIFGNPGNGDWGYKGEFIPGLNPLRVEGYTPNVIVVGKTGTVGRFYTVEDARLKYESLITQYSYHFIGSGDAIDRIYVFVK